jgi:hypothetical protein
MSALFDRKYRVEIDGEGVRASIEELRVIFSVQKTRSFISEMQIRVYNPSQTTRLTANKTRAQVRLFAGYGTPLLVAQAQITRAYIERDPPDVILVLECLDGIIDLRRTRVSLSFERGATVAQVLEAITDQLGLPVRPIAVDLQSPLRGGYSHVGGVGVALDDMTEQAGAVWSIQNGEILILGKGDPVPGEVALISPQSGMIASPEPIDEEIGFDDIGGSARFGYTVRALLQPQIEPGQQVRIESRDVQGLFRVEEIEHKGDTEGPEFESIMKLYE